MSKLLNIPCKECGKIGVKCKELCTACYSKEWRSTPLGIERKKEYDATKQREANKRWIDKQPKKNRETYREYCECGKKATVKGFCSRCYCKYYQRKKYNRAAKPKITPLNEKLFQAVLVAVQDGTTISEACRMNNIDRKKFYHAMTDIQKYELTHYRAVNNKFRVLAEPYLSEADEETQ